MSPKQVAKGLAMDALAFLKLTPEKEAFWREVLKIPKQ